MPPSSTYSLMTEWKRASLAQITTKIGSGATPRGGKGAYVKDGIALIRSMNVHDSRFVYDDLARITDEQAARLNNVVVEGHDVLVNITGASVARVCLAPADTLPARVNQHVAIVRADRTVASPGYIQAYLASPLGKSRLLSLASAGATREALTKQMLEDYELPLPPVSTQRRVAAVLRAIDDLIENNRRRVEVLEEMARAIYREWFVHLRFPGHEVAAFVDSDLGRMPEGWRCARSGELMAEGALDIGDGYRAKNAEMVGGEEGLPFLRVANVQDGYLDLTRVDRLPSDYLERLKSKVARPGDTVLCMKGTVGRMARIPADSPPMAYSPQVSWWRSLGAGSLPPAFLHEWLRSDAFVRQCAAVKGATDMADYVNLKDQRRMRLVVPDEHTVKEFVQAVDPLHRLADELRASADVLTKMRELLLPKLVTGQIDVSDLDLDAVVEKASA